MSRGDSKLKILCLHGYRQDASVFRSKLGAFRKITKKYADLTFITAPVAVPSPTQDDTSLSEMEASDKAPLQQYGWWFSRADWFNAHDFSDTCEGFDISLQVIKDAFEQEGPFDGLLGFSQGAAMVSLLCGLKTQNKFAYNFNFVILIAGFKSRASPHNEIYQQKITCPSLHVIGETDQIIPKEMSEELLEHFTNYEILLHPGRHHTPAAGPQKSAYINFLTKMQAESSLH